MVDRGEVGVETSEKESSTDGLEDGSVDTQALLAHRSLSETAADEGPSSSGKP